MFRNSLTVSLIAIVAMFTAGCGSADEPPAPISIDQRPITSAELGGIAVADQPEPQTVAQFAKAHNKTVAELKATGMTSGTAQQFKLNGPGTTFSVVAAYETPEQAKTEAARLFKSNSTQDEGVKVKPLEISGVPGAQAIALSGEQDGQDFTGYEIVYSDGNLVYELFAIGSTEEVSSSAGMKAVQSQYDRVQGHPLPAA
ncbi:MAG: hypothetical protein WAO61_04270 [Solirubrobacterales bacterium]